MAPEAVKPMTTGDKLVKFLDSNSDDKPLDNIIDPSEFAAVGIKPNEDIKEVKAGDFDAYIKGLSAQETVKLNDLAEKWNNAHKAADTEAANKAAQTMKKRSTWFGVLLVGGGIAAAVGAAVASGGLLVVALAILAAIGIAGGTTLTLTGLLGRAPDAIEKADKATIEEKVRADLLKKELLSFYDNFIAWKKKAAGATGPELPVPAPSGVGGDKK
jgi:hypothetical protein